MTSQPTERVAVTATGRVAATFANLGRLGKRDRMEQRQLPFAAFAVEDDRRRSRDVLRISVHRVVLVEPAGQDARIAPDLLVRIPKLRSDVRDSPCQLAQVRIDLTSAA